MKSGSTAHSPHLAGVNGCFDQFYRCLRDAWVHSVLPAPTQDRGGPPQVQSFCASWMPSAARWQHSPLMPKRFTWGEAGKKKAARVEGTPTYSPHRPPLLSSLALSLPERRFLGGALVGGSGLPRQVFSECKGKPRFDSLFSF